MTKKPPKLTPDQLTELRELNQHGQCAAFHKDYIATVWKQLARKGMVATRYYDDPTLLYANITDKGIQTLNAAEAYLRGE